MCCRADYPRLVTHEPAWLRCGALQALSRCPHTPPPPQGWKGIVSNQAPHSTAAVAAMCMLVMELTRVLPEWNNWL